MARVAARREQQVLTSRKCDPCDHAARLPEFGEIAMAGTCTVDAVLFDNVKQAIDFVAEHGGGVVYTELAGTKFAQSLKLPDNVQLEPRRTADEPAAAEEQAA
jgi:hypothetical protein